MEWWLLTFTLGAILSLFLPIVPDLFYLIVFISLFVLSLSYKPFRSSSGLFLGATWLIFSGWQYQDIWSANQILSSELNHHSRVVIGEVVSLPTYTATYTSPRLDSKHEQVQKTKGGNTQSIKKTYRFNMLVRQIKTNKLNKPFKIRLRWDNPNIALKQGQQLKLNVKIKPAHGLANVGGFSYQAWLFEKNLVATGYVKAYIPYNKRKNSTQNLDAGASLRQKLYDKYNANLPKHNLSALLLALSFGERSKITPPLWDVLKATGTQHLIAISGLHLGLVATASFFIISGLLSILPMAWLYRSFSQNENPPARILTLNLHYITILLSLAFTLLYAYLADFSLPTLRALLMIFLYWLSKCLHIKINLVRWLLLTVFIIVLSAPLSLISSSFWLSFYAVSMIFLVLWRFSSLFSLNADSTKTSAIHADEISGTLPHKNTHTGNTSKRTFMVRLLAGLKSLFIIQCALTVCLLPLTVLFFQQVSLVGFIANIVAVPTMSLIIIPLCLFSVISLPFSESLSGLLMELALYFLEWLWQGLTYLTSLPYALISLSMSQSFLVASVISILIIYLLLLPMNPKQLIKSIIKQPMFNFISVRFWVFFSLFLCSFGFITIYNDQVLELSTIKRLEVNASESNKAANVFSTTSWQVNVLDVGQGLAVIIQRGNKAILYDTGAAFPSGFNMAEAVIIPYLRNQGLKSLDKIIISHSDNDHAGGIKYLQEQLTVNSVIANIDKKYFTSTPIQAYCLQGQNFTWQGLTFTQLWPQLFKGKDNDDSCVIHVSDGLTSFLLTGDISKKVEQRLVLLDRARIKTTSSQSKSQLKSDVLIVPHHGSKTSSRIEFINQVSPQIAVFSAGYLNRWHMPVAEVVQRYDELGITTYNTATAGMIRFTVHHSPSDKIKNSAGKRMKVETYRDDLSPYWFMNIGL